MTSRTTRLSFDTCTVALWQKFGSVQAECSLSYSQWCSVCPIVHVSRFVTRWSSTVCRIKWSRITKLSTGIWKCVQCRSVCKRVHFLVWKLARFLLGMCVTFWVSSTLVGGSSSVTLKWLVRTVWHPRVSSFRLLRSNLSCVAIDKSDVAVWSVAYVSFFQGITQVMVNVAGLLLPGVVGFYTCLVLIGIVLL